MPGKYVVYTGLRVLEGKDILHCPLIKVSPRPLKDAHVSYLFSQLENYTCLIFTSQSSVDIFFSYLRQFPFHSKKQIPPLTIAVGGKTAQLLRQYEVANVLAASNETAEGIIELIEKKNLQCERFLWPHSARSRPLLKDYFARLKFSYYDCVLYDTLFTRPYNFPPLDYVKEIIFTSPSTVESYIYFFGKLPQKIPLRAIGPITQKTLDKYNRFC